MSLVESLCGRWGFRLHDGTLKPDLQAAGDWMHQTSRVDTSGYPMYLAESGSNIFPAQWIGPVALDLPLLVAVPCASLRSD